MWNSIRMELYKIFRMRSFWVISIIMIGLVFMTTEFNCDDMKAARQEQSASVGNVSGQEQSTSEGNISGQEQSASEGNVSGQQNKDGLQVSKAKKKDQANLERYNIFWYFRGHQRDGCRVSRSLRYVFIAFEIGYFDNDGAYFCDNVCDVRYQKWIYQKYWRADGT